ncbi:MAG TPA: DNA sulfur modification protein DndB [Candidatus Nitrosotenuis sp.]|nr:DNA sulfur modification protein DndB [Candidatus Nitrosotenuis sp.]
MSKTLADELETGSEVYGFDALRGTQAGRDYYVAMCPLKIIPKLFVFNEFDLPPQLRAQRTLRASRIPQIASYIVNNPKDYVFSSLTASVDGKMKFSPSPSVGENGKIGRLYISMNCRMLINDGQHRRAAIEEALKQKPELGNETISVVFFEDKGLKRSQQMFADLNKHAVKPTKSLGILYDHRDTFAQFIVKLVNALPIFHGRVELERTSISNRSTKFFTLNGVTDATKNLLKPKSKNITEEEQKLAAEFWDEVSKNIPEWQLLIDKKVSAWELRKEFVHAHTNFVNALGIAGHILITQFPDSWKQKLRGLQKVDWARDSPIWQGKLMLDGKMLKNRIGIKKAAEVILQACGVTKTLDEFEPK